MGWPKSKLQNILSVRYCFKILLLQVHDDVSHWSAFYIIYPSEGNTQVTGGFPSQKSSYVELSYFYCHLPQKNVQQRANLSHGCILLVIVIYTLLMASYYYMPSCGSIMRRLLWKKWPCYEKTYCGCRLLINFDQHNIVPWYTESLVFTMDAVADVKFWIC